MAEDRWPARIEALPRVGSRLLDEQAEQVRAGGVKLLKLSAYPKRKIPDDILQAAWATASRLEHAPARGQFALRQAIAAYWEPLSGRSIDPAREVLITCGAMHALQCAMLALLDPGDEVLIFTPSYFFEGLVTLAGGVLREVRLSEENEFEWNVGAFERQINPRTRMIILNTPTNPTGVVASREILEQIQFLAEKHQIFVVCDESYERMVYDGRSHVSLLATQANRERTIMVASFTKSFGLAPWRVGYAIASHKIIDAILKILEWSVLFAPSLNQDLAYWVLNHDKSWLAGINNEFQTNRDLLLKELKACPEVSALTPQGGPFLFVNIQRACQSDKEFSSHLLQNHGLAATPGQMHGAPGYIRVPFGGITNDVIEAGRRICTAATEMMLKV